MNPIGGVVVYLILWWVVLFAVLPVGVRAQWEEGETHVPGTEPGAPARINMWRKLAWTTLIAAGLWGLLDIAVISGLVPFERLAGIDDLR